MSPERGAERTRHWIDLVSAAILAGATMATAWSAYQSALWGRQYSAHSSKSLGAVVRVTKLSTLALQRTAVHANLFVHWIIAVNSGDSKSADFLLARFPEPLKTSTMAWRATDPMTNPQAPGSPFDMAEYKLPERLDADKWEQTATSEAAAAERAGDTANRYLLFTIIFASVLFFAGVSGKCRWNVMDVSLLILGALTLIGGVTAMIALPRA
jgi:hypothetical protein